MNTTLIYLFVSIGLGAMGQILLKVGVNRIGQINLVWPHLVNTLINVFMNLWIIGGVICFASSMILWIKVISDMDLSKAYPTVSLSYAIVFLFSVLLFNEPVSMGKIIGLFLVTFGVFFLQM